ncbi:carbon-nitrogen hydrolase family protein [Halobellus sp. Atlit-31R]|nr:carbon-nitrogen hydrolase family protein [Halobellus sp. Atlit-31R]
MNGRIATCQFEPVVGDVAANLDRIRSLAAESDADLAVFPELCVTGYDLDAAGEYAAEIPGRLTAPLVEIAAATGTELVVGLPERDGETLYNTFALVDGSGVQATYRKYYRWGDEATAFEAGAGPVVAETSVGRVGFVLCYDLNFPELALTYAREECDLLAVGAAWRASFRSNWRLLCRSRALDGPCYVAAANHRGEQRGRQHAGTSLIAGPEGSVLSETGDGPGTATASVDDAALRAAHERNPIQETRAKVTDPRCRRGEDE